MPLLHGHPCVPANGRATTSPGKGPRSGTQTPWTVFCRAAAAKRRCSRGAPGAGRGYAAAGPNDPRRLTREAAQTRHVPQAGSTDNAVTRPIHDGHSQGVPGQEKDRPAPPAVISFSPTSFNTPREGSIPTTTAPGAWRSSSPGLLLETARSRSHCQTALDVPGPQEAQNLLAPAYRRLQSHVAVGRDSPGNGDHFDGDAGVFRRTFATQRLVRVREGDEATGRSHASPQPIRSAGRPALYQ